MSHPAFDLLDELRLPLGAARHFRHRGSGADVVVLDDQRAESCFSISFATRPQDDGGAAHVLEHLVFRGSRDAPDDQLYTALKTGSLISHLNASTRATTTSYQLGSPVTADLARAEAILLGAVFHPLLSRDAFEQEAFSWREQRPSGVVFHEMCGHLARPEARLELGLRRALFPGAAEGRCYGGDPVALSRLQPAEVEAFHRAFYRPENALVILSGDAQLGPRLDGLAAAFDGVCDGTPRTVIAPPSPAGSTAPCGVSLRLETGASALGWSLQVLPQELALLLAEILREAAGPGLWPEPVLITDGAWPYLQLLSPQALRLDPKAVAERLEESGVRAAVERCLMRLLDDTADFRLPAGLQGRAALLGAWRRGTPLLEPLELPARLEAVLLDPGPPLSALRAALRHLPPLREADAPARPDLSALAAPPPRRETVRAAAPPGWTLPPLPGRLLPRLAPKGTCSEDDGILLLPDPADGLLRVCIGIDLTGLAQEVRAQLPALAAALRRRLGAERVTVTTRPGPEHPLLISLKLREGELTSTLAALRESLLELHRAAEPPPGEAPHLALARALRGDFWGRDLDVAAAPQGLPTLHRAITAQNLALATNRPAASAALAGFRDGLPPGSPQKSGTRRRPSVEAHHLDIVLPGLALPLAGRAGDLSALSPGLAWLGLRAIEHGLLWPRLRVAGGAYGLRVSMDAEGIATLVTAQDPTPWRSLAVMAEAGGWLAENAGSGLLEQGRIAAVGQIFAPLPPDLALEEAVLARMAGRAPGWRQEDLDAVLSAALPELRAVGRRIAGAFAAGPSAIMAPIAVPQPD